MSDELRSQILETASRLFFTQGYTQTGINQLIDESGVARRTFYRYFESKDSLGSAYLNLSAERWLHHLHSACAGKSSALATLKALFEYLEAFARDTAFRGCGMLNMTAEFADASTEVRRQVRQHKDAQRRLIGKLLAEHAVKAELADQVHVLFEGAIAAAAAHVELWPIHAAHRAAKSIVDDKPPTPKARPQRRPKASNK